ncbi:hypothetical protein BJ684DRAFT_7881 [Piptocephalis cylindrospora]|uniref:UspA domain-containing protein n=1 Tax=Piptocephalis cylindrospora TaxID=1907219 RepID=A0A4P9Y770_9FUNG|nr:hypothetical protein BJ684DRAFT_7881 [Piptocephalis cylindrospora]|eukprot:RKP14895.1 hypothetical protein BJ684DRAFT_7881 [Piptocephalis cylindrospora]
MNTEFTPFPSALSYPSHLHSIFNNMSKSSQNARSVVIAVDPAFSQSPHIIQWALENFLRKGDDVDLVTCLSVDAPSDATDLGIDFIYVGEMLAKQEDDLGKQAVKGLDTLAGPLLKAGVSKRLLKGTEEPGDLLVKYVNGAQVSTLIIGNRNLSFFNRIFVGSVADACVHMVHCPVLVVKSPEE